MHLLEDVFSDPPEHSGEKTLQIPEMPNEKPSLALGCSTQAGASCWPLDTIERRSCLWSGCSQTLLFFFPPRLLQNWQWALYINVHNLLWQHFVQKTKTSNHFQAVLACHASRNKQKHKWGQFSAGSQHSAKQLVHVGARHYHSPLALHLFSLLILLGMGPSVVRP